MSKTLRLALRGICLCLCVALLGVLVAPAVATPAQPATEQLPASEQTLTSNVYGSASVYAVVIGQMENGTCVTIKSSYGSFYRIDCYDMSGYIPKEQVEMRDDGKYYVNCNAESVSTQVLTYYPHAQAVQLRQSLLALAEKQIGSRYVYGGTRPGGFDCSGLMLYLYGQHGITLNRTASNQLCNGLIVAREGMQAGDLVFFRERWETYPASHVGIYVGDNKIIHSGSRGVVVADLSVDWFAETFLCARRIVNTKAAAIAAPPVLSVTNDVCISQSAVGRTAH